MNRAVILVDPTRFVDAMPAITSLVREPQILVASPLLVVATDDPGLQQVEKVPGVVAVTIVDELQLGLLHGIDWAIQLNLGLLSDFAIGGITPGSDYPAIPNEPQGTLAPYAICAAVNLSLAPPDDDVALTLPGDPINHATRALSEFTIPVVAAGNHHSIGASFETMSPWAEPDWVLAVGATSDEAGEVEWTKSGRGTARRPGVGPDILAWGQDLLSVDGFGTSFAAALMSRMIVWTRAWLLQVLANIDRLSGGQFGVPLVGAMIVDRRFNAEGLEPADFDWAALPVLATQPGAVETLAVDEILALGERVAWPRTHHATRAVVQAAAVATSPETTIPLSAPSLTPQRLAAFLDELSAPALAALLDPSAGRGGRKSNEVAPPLFPRGTLDRIAKLVTASQPMWEFDIDKRTARKRRRGEEGT